MIWGSVRCAKKIRLRPFPRRGALPCCSAGRSRRRDGEQAADDEQQADDAERRDLAPWRHDAARLADSAVRRLSTEPPLARSSASPWFTLRAARPRSAASAVAMSSSQPP